MESKIILKTSERFEACRETVGDRLFLDVSSKIAAQSGEKGFYLKWIYASSPPADWGRYDFGLFRSIAEQGLFLRHNSPYAKELDEELFLSYVLHPRVNDERLSDCRAFFYGLLKDRVKELPIEEAVFEVNRFCAENVSYHGSDDRTRSAVSAYLFATGRCGEESVFAVNALRAVGIPARQVYAPLWSHCDDNHAWVEVYIKGDWHFFGACEIEKVLDCGWFNGSASRAMFAYARCFGDPPEGEVLFFEPPLAYINVLPRYASSKAFTVCVKDGAHPVAGARVCFEILNYGRFTPVLPLVTNAEGIVRTVCGRGSVRITVQKGAKRCETLVDTREGEEVVLNLRGRTPSRFEFVAPEGGTCGEKPSELQRAEASKEKMAADALRQQKPIPNLRDMFCELKEEGELLYSVLPEKDRQDIHPDVVRDAIECSAAFRGQFPDEVFARYLLSPRIENEPLFADRRAIFEFFSKVERDKLKNFPEKIYERAFCGTILPRGMTRTYPSPLAVLKGEPADEVSRKILFVAICRALGIPARLSPIDKAAQYFRDGKFLTLPEEPCSKLVLEGTCESFSLTRITSEGDVAIDTFSDERMGEAVELTLPAGEYELVTQNRLPSGNSLGTFEKIILAAGESRTVRIKKTEATLSQLTVNIPLEELAPKEDGVFVFLEPGAEPSEHFLAELKTLKRGELFPRFLLREGREPSEEMRALGSVGYFRRDTAERIARRLYVEPEKFPLVVIVKEGRARFVSEGYRVGTVNLVKKICRSLNSDKGEKS